MNLVSIFRSLQLALALALLAATASAEPSHCSKLGDSAGVLAQLDRVAPDLQVTRDGQLVPTASCMPLRRGDVVETRSAPALIQFAEGLILLMPNSKAKIGSIWSYFGELFSFGHVKVQDRYVTAGAEGTSYVFRSDAEGNTVTVLQGHVRVTPNQSGISAQRLEAGQRLSVSPNAASSLTRLTPLELGDMLRSYQALTGYTAAELTQLEQAFTQPAELANRGRDTAAALVQGAFSFGGGGAPVELGAGSVALAWSHRFTRLGSLPLGTRVLGGAGFGRNRSPMTDPKTGQEEAAQDGTARLPFHGAFAQLDAELGSNARFLNLVGSLGLRGGWSHQRDVTSQPDRFVWGPAITARAEYTVVSGYRLLLEAELWAQRTPVYACPVGCNEDAQPRPSIWQAWLGFSVGVGVDL